MYFNSLNLFFKRKNKIINRYLLIERASTFFFAPGRHTPASSPGPG